VDVVYYISLLVEVGETVAKLVIPVLGEYDALLNGSNSLLELLDFVLKL
jgi:hypothetical protein